MAGRACHHNLLPPAHPGPAHARSNEQMFGLWRVIALHNVCDRTVIAGRAVRAMPTHTHTCMY